MVFASLSFLIMFLTPALALCFLLPKKCRNYGLFAIGIVFYALGEPVYVLLLLAEIFWAWGFGLGISRAEGRKKKGMLILCIFGQIGVLAFFKYGGYLAGLAGGSVLSDLVLPAGISFYSFQAVSYAVDVYRGGKPQKNPVLFGLYLSFFPQLIAGPIVRYGEIEQQLTDRQVTAEGFSRGVLRFSAGLCKKVLLANMLGQLADHVFDSAEIAQMSSATLWLAALAYTFQIYFDFSGYSDMAIGLGAMFGFRLPENFKDPYTAGTATEFWRRWHMTLSAWFRDYVYIPLGGNRKGFARECLYLMIVWALTGIWHGAGGTFLLWGVLWGLLLILEKGWIHPEKRRLPFRILYRCVFLVCVILLWVIFRAPDLWTAGEMLSGMFRFRAAAGRPLETALWLHDLWPYLAAAAFLSAGGATFLKKQAGKLKGKRSGTVLYALSLAGLLGLSWLAVSCLVSGSYNPFLYFSF